MIHFLFKKFKLTTNIKLLMVNTKCFYQPTLIIKSASPNTNFLNQNELWFEFSITQFVAVTAYKNLLVSFNVLFLMPYKTSSTFTCWMYKVKKLKVYVLEIFLLKLKNICTLNITTYFVSDLYCFKFFYYLPYYKNIKLYLMFWLLLYLIFFEKNI